MLANILWITVMVVLTIITIIAGFIVYYGEKEEAEIKNEKQKISLDLQSTLSQAFKMRKRENT